MFFNNDEIKRIVKESIIANRENVPGKHSANAHLYNFKEGITPEGNYKIHFFSTGGIFHNCWIAFTISNEGLVWCDHCWDEGMLKLEDIVFNQLEQCFKGEGIKTKFEFEDIIHNNHLLGRKRKLRIVDEYSLIEKSQEYLPCDSPCRSFSASICTDIEPRKNPILISSSQSSDNVHFSVAGPKSANPGSNFLLTFWAYLNSQRDEVLKRIYDSHSRENTKIHYKGPVKIERETLITLFVEIDDLILKQNIASIFWTSEIISESFLVSVPEKVSTGTKIGVISVLFEGIEISKILFSLEITNSSTPTQSLPVDVIFHQKAFASYSSKDAKEVLSRIQAMEIVAPWLKVFIDFDGIRAGQYWKEELKKSISNMDVFYLFWSENAANSDWVRREWQCALNSRGLDYIQPVPLVNPDKVPPPPELCDKQFKDRWSCYIEWENSKDEHTKFRAKHVFVSYASNDKTIADAVVASLEREKIRCWIAPRDILPGMNFQVSLVKAVKTSAIMVLIFSQSSNRSAHITREVNIAVDAGVIIIPFRTQDVPLSGEMQYLVANQHWMDAITPPLEERINELCGSVQMLYTDHGKKNVSNSIMQKE